MSRRFLISISKHSAFNRIRSLLTRHKLDTSRDTFCLPDSSVGDAHTWHADDLTFRNLHATLRLTPARVSRSVNFSLFPRTFPFPLFSERHSHLSSCFALRIPLRIPRAIASGFRFRHHCAALLVRDNGTLCSWTILPRESRSFTREHSRTLPRDDMFASVKFRDEGRTFAPSQSNLRHSPVPGRFVVLERIQKCTFSDSIVSFLCLVARVLVKIIFKHLISALEQIIR